MSNNDISKCKNHEDCSANANDKLCYKESCVGCIDDIHCSNGYHCNNQSHQCIKDCVDSECQLGYYCHEDIRECVKNLEDPDEMPARIIALIVVLSVVGFSMLMGILYFIYATKSTGEPESLSSRTKISSLPTTSISSQPASTTAKKLTLQSIYEILPKDVTNYLLFHELSELNEEEIGFKIIDYITNTKTFLKNYKDSMTYTIDPNISKIIDEFDNEHWLLNNKVKAITNLRSIIEYFIIFTKEYISNQNIADSEIKFWIDYAIQKFQKNEYMEALLTLIKIEKKKKILR